MSHICSKPLTEQKEGIKCPKPISRQEHVKCAHGEKEVAKDSLDIARDSMYESE
jgi:hypothetical protein